MGSTRHFYMFILAFVLVVALTIYLIVDSVVQHSSSGIPSVYVYRNCGSEFRNERRDVRSL